MKSEEFEKWVKKENPYDGDIIELQFRDKYWKPFYYMGSDKNSIHVGTHKPVDGLGQFVLPIVSVNSIRVVERCKNAD